MYSRAIERRHIAHNDLCIIYVTASGAEQENTKAILIVKTRTALFPKVEKTIKKIHSYSCPGILAVPVLCSSKDCADWIVMETT